MPDPLGPGGWAYWRDRFATADAERTHLRAEIERIRNLAADMMDLLNEMPIKHPQQATRRKVLEGQCRQFGVCEQQERD